MQQDIRTLAGKAAAIEQELKQQFPQGVVPITSQKMYTSTEHKEGMTLEVKFGVAARHIAKGSHRVATPEEHEAFKQDMQDRNEQHAKQTLDKRMAQGVVIDANALRSWQNLAPAAAKPKAEVKENK